MLPEERRKHIIDALRENGKVEVDELSETLGVSPMTIRRDLSALEEKGLVVRTYGGAVYPDIMNYEVPVNSKEISSRSEKERIGKAASELIQEGQSIILDAGTTTLEIARNLKHKRNITVITNDIRIANELYSNHEITLYCIGGFVQPNVGAIIGSHAESFIESINVDYAFIGAPSIDEDYIVSTPTLDKAFLKKKIMQHANVVVLIADHTKFKKRSLNRICKLEDVDILVSDSGLEEETKKDIGRIVKKLILA